jgi:hypothetical protein
VLIRMLLGVILGSLGAGVPAIYLRRTREARMARKMITIRLGYLIVGVASIISLSVLVASLGQIGRGHVCADKLSVWSYAASYLLIVSLAFRGELRSRRAISQTKNDG